MKMGSPNLGYSYHLPSAGWNLKVRNALSQCSDIFSEFNKYIAPAYHHDRCERYLFFTCVTLFITTKSCNERNTISYFLYV